jgi:hypothetical protein
MAEYSDHNTKQACGHHPRSIERLEYLPSDEQCCDG